MGRLRRETRSGGTSVNFTTETPTTPGDFAWKETPESPHVLKQVVLDTLTSGINCEHLGQVLNVDEIGGLWCRIVAAEEVEKAWREARLGLTTLESSLDAFNDSRAKRVVENGDCN